MRSLESECDHGGNENAAATFPPRRPHGSAGRNETKCGAGDTMEGRHKTRKRRKAVFNGTMVGTKSPLECDLQLVEMRCRRCFSTQRTGSKYSTKKEGTTMEALLQVPAEALGALARVDKDYSVCGGRHVQVGKDSSARHPF